jgi:CubicO group peptidase (beta-lactamase class C family)
MLPIRISRFNFLGKLRRMCACVSVGFVTAVLSSCSGETRPYSPPVATNDGWAVSTPSAEGMDQQLVEGAVAGLQAENKGLDGLVIVRNGKLVVDEYYNSYDAAKTHKIWSVTKPVMATLVGIAIDKGLIRSEKDSIAPYLIGWLGDKPILPGVTIEHLLTMTSGISWVEMGGEQSAGFKMAYADDWVSFVLNQPMDKEPGKVFNYSSGNAVLLAPIVKQATGTHADEFAREYLFSPLGITNYEWVKGSEFWEKTEGGELPAAKKPEPSIAYKSEFAPYPNTASGLKMRPRDMAKLGQLYLAGGIWAGKQVVSRQWIDAATHPHFGNAPYGYCWNLVEYTVNSKKVTGYYASGFGIQRIYIFPAAQLVVVFTQQNYGNMSEANEQTEKVLTDYILKAVK